VCPGHGIDTVHLNNTHDESELSMGPPLGFPPISKTNSPMPAVVMVVNPMLGLVVS